MRFSWHRGQPAPTETRLRDLLADSGTSDRSGVIPDELSDEQLAGLALRRISGLRELPAARLEAIGRRGFARSGPKPSMVALRWSLATLATVLVLNLAVAAGLYGIDHFGPRISQLLAADHARLAANAQAGQLAKIQPSAKTSGQIQDDDLAKASHLLWVDHDPQAALAAFVAYVQHNPKASPENAVLAAETTVGWDTELAHAEGMRDSSRCSEALHVYEKVLSAGPVSADLRERATYGRAQCLRQTGDEAGAKAELHRYLTSYPKGKFAAEARKALE